MLSVLLGVLDALGSALILFGGACAGLVRTLVRPDRFARRRILGALARAVFLPLPLVGALSAALGATVALAIGFGFAIGRLEEALLPAMRILLLRQAAPLLVGLLVLGQAGLGLTSGLVGLQASGEADTLRSLRVDPARWVLPPALLEFALFGAVQFVAVAFVAQLAAALVLQGKFGVPALHYFDILAGPSARADMWSGVARSEASALLTWVAAATIGVRVADGPEGMEHATRATFFASLLGTLLINTVFTGFGA